MYIPEKLKLNRFKEVRIPKKREYFQKLGLVNPNPKLYTGATPMPISKRRIDLLNEQVIEAEKAR